jgi:hypothetical protein
MHGDHTFFGHKTIGEMTGQFLKPIISIPLIYGMYFFCCCPAIAHCISHAASHISLKVLKKNQQLWSNGITAAELPYIFSGFPLYN